MNLDFQPAARFSCGELAKIFNNAFDGYIGGIPNFDVHSFGEFVASHHVDLTLSKVVTNGSDECGLGLVSRFDRRSRIVAMGIAGTSRGHGMGRRLLDDLIGEANERADSEVVLEVIEQNGRAVRLYERSGFDVVRHLYGFVLDTPAYDKAGPLLDIDVLELLGRLVKASHLNLPWQISLPNLTRIEPTARIHRLDDVTVVVLPAEERTTVRSLFSTTGWAADELKRCLNALFHKYPEQLWYFPAVFPEEYAEVLSEFGAERSELSQFQMVKVL